MTHQHFHPQRAPLRRVPIVRVITPPAPLLTAQDLNRRLRLDLNFDSPMSAEDVEVQTDVEAMIAAATSMLDGPMGKIGRALGLQMLEVSVQTCGDSYVQLPCPPVVEIDDVEWDDKAGATTSLSEPTYRLIRESIYFPAGAPDAADMRIQYRAGYSTVPPSILQAIRLLVGDMWAFRESVGQGTYTELAIGPTVEALIAPFRIFAVG